MLSELCNDFTKNMYFVIWRCWDLRDTFFLFACISEIWMQKCVTLCLNSGDTWLYDSSSLSEYYLIILLNLINLNCPNLLCPFAPVSANKEPYNKIQNVLISISEYVALFTIVIICHMDFFHMEIFPVTGCVYSLLKII